MTNNLGFLLEKEIADSKEEDFVLGSEAQPDLKGISDSIACLDWALHAWSYPVGGIYPKINAPLNHASLGINEKAKPFLPIGTVQRGRDDWMNCTTNAPCNDLETQFNYGLDKGLFTPNLVEWFKKVGFINNGKFEIADAWVSIGSGNTRNGNSLKAPVEFIRKNGIVPKSKMLDNKSMSWGQYHDKARITPEIKAIAEELSKYIEFGYEKVYRRDFEKFTQGLKWKDFDSYVDPVDGDFIKKLAPDYIFMNYAYHLTINQIGEPKGEPNKEETMKFYKRKEDPKIYQLGVDGLYHHLIDEPVFKGLYGDFSNHEIIEIEIPEDKIGFTIYDKQSFISLILNLLGKNNS
ncbi:MAG: hypothetical protein HQ538_01565 [Parcubacteria group bacterium]|nr:hypothetical protein [Parcubacteria group bacterium]